MKVLDLKCGNGHVFEGWFGSEDDFVHQCQSMLVLCPVCGDSSVIKQLSAPRLALSGHRNELELKQLESAPLNPSAVKSSETEIWLAVARAVIANTTDVGDSFAEEARRIYYGESLSRHIRGTTTPTEARSLIEEGIDVIALPIPVGLKGTLQ